MINQILGISKLKKQLLLLAVDSCVVILILLTAFALRNNYWSIPNNELGTLALLIFCSPILAIPIFTKFGLYRAIIRYIELKILWEITKASIVYSLCLAFLVYITGTLGFSRSVIFINLLLLIIVISGLRFLAMWLLNKSSFKSTLDSKNVVIYGAGSAGRQLAAALALSNQYNPVAFIDDESLIQHREIRGIQVFPLSVLKALIEENNIVEVLVAIPSITRNRRLEIINFLATFPVIVKSLPGVSELAQGKIDISDLKKVSIDDLLGRSKVKVNNDLLYYNVLDKVVLVTGAGGSIGSELCRQIVSLNANKLILYESNEFSLYQINHELTQLLGPDTRIYPILGSTENKIRFSYIVDLYKVNTIYHAAAYKHVPMVETNATEGVKNNIFSTFICAEVAIDYGVETFVFVSTDKAVRPTNIMGATKRFSEQLLQGLSEIKSMTDFTIVRFGNVLGSSGSVIPLFKKQIKQGGPITITDRNMTRYFMLISEAVELIIQAGAMGGKGKVFVLDMGSPVKIIDFAKKMINLSGLSIKDEKNPAGDIEIISTGTRPGEKLYEELLIGDDVSITKHPMIMKANESFMPLTELKSIMIDLEKSTNENDLKSIRKLLIKAVPEFKPQSEIDHII
jgi:FlaA1/EpsC-like NDP-sugar epimerase